MNESERDSQSTVVHFDTDPLTKTHFTIINIIATPSSTLGIIKKYFCFSRNRKVKILKITKRKRLYTQKLEMKKHDEILDDWKFNGKLYR